MASFTLGWNVAMIYQHVVKHWSGVYHWVASVFHPIPAGKQLVGVDADGNPLRGKVLWRLVQLLTSNSVSHWDILELEVEARYPTLSKALLQHSGMDSDACLHLPWCCLKEVIPPQHRPWPTSFFRYPVSKKCTNLVLLLNSDNTWILFPQCFLTW